MSASRAQIEILETQQVFLLDGDLVSIGRASDNTLVLSSSEVSRYHAHLVWNTNSYEIVDLDSSSGTCVNEKELSPRLSKPLMDSDIIRISNYHLRFFYTKKNTRPFSWQESATTVQLLSSQNTITTISHFRNAPILCITTPQGSRKFPLKQEILSLGRDADNDIVINSSVVSGRHAQLKRCERGYEIFAKGKNGLIFEGCRIAQKRLLDGDVLYIGSDITLAYQANPSVRESPPTEILDLRDRATLALGRDLRNDTVIDHPSVSRFHAYIKRKNGSLFITDLNSTNGTFVNGQQITRECILKPGDNIRIGPCRLIFNFDETLLRQNEEGNLRLDVLNLSKIVGKGTTLLDDISLSILPREFVVIAGVSGGGKSTLLDALNGFRPTTSGTVLVNGDDLYKNFAAYRNDLGYVPQKDIVHMELTVAQALDYAARLRMPTDTTRAERKARIDEVLEELGLSHRRNVPVKNLSGGQLKRVSIGVELLTKPSLFFLDEATSGLDPGTEADIMHLLRKLADQGRTVILITHATENVTLCDLVVFLAAGGRVAYLGAPAEAPEYFGVQRFNEIYHKVERDRSPAEWQNLYRLSPQHQKYVVERQASLKNRPVEAQKTHSKRQPLKNKVKSISAWRQFLILSERNLAILLRDRASLILMLAIAPILGILDFFTWKRDIFDIESGDASQAIVMLFTACLIAVMVGSLATMREIVKEVDIYRRERAIGLMSLPYILSKIWFVIILAIYQAAVFLAFKIMTVNIPGSLAGMYVALLSATIAGMIMGLLVSAISPNQNVAPLLTIIFLVPQVIFGGGMLPASDFGLPGKVLNNMTLTKWPFETLVTITGFGTDVVEDPCWQKSKAERNKLTETEKNQQCQCLGSNLFNKCEFPGLKAKYDKEAKAAVDNPEPAKPKSPGNLPSNPSALKDYQEKMDRYQKDIEVWQKNFSKWKEQRESAIGGAEELLDRFKKQYGSAFKVNLIGHLRTLALLMVAMLGGVLVAQKRKDVV